MTAIPIDSVAEPFIRLRATHHLDNGYLVIFAGGIGNPYVTTDYPGVQRALEIRADAILYAKHRTNGVHTDDPNKNPDAKLYEQINYSTVIHENLGNSLVGVRASIHEVAGGIGVGPVVAAIEAGDDFAISVDDVGGEGAVSIVLGGEHLWLT